MRSQGNGVRETIMDNQINVNDLSPEKVGHMGT